MNFISYNPPTKKELKAMRTSLKRDKSVFGVCCCKLIEFITTIVGSYPNASWEYLVENEEILLGRDSDKDHIAILRQFLLNNVLVEICSTSSLYSFLDAFHIDSDNALNKTWSYDVLRMHVIDMKTKLMLLDVTWGLNIIGTISNIPSHMLVNELLKEIRNGSTEERFVSENIIFKNLLGERLETRISTEWLAEFPSKIFLAKDIDEKYLTFSKYITDKMLLRVDNKIYSYNELCEKMDIEFS